MPENEKSSLEQIIVAGIDAITKTAETAGDLLDELVKKGELTVEQGKALNEELKHEIKETVSTKAQSAQTSAVSYLVEKMEHLTPEELDIVQAKIDELKKAEGV